VISFLVLMEDAAGMAASLDAGFGARSKLNVAVEMRLANGSGRNFSATGFFARQSRRGIFPRITRMT
jgi:hypothetical protein